LADVFERSVLRLAVTKGGVLDATASKRLADDVVQRFDVAPERLVVAKKAPPKTGASVEVLVAPERALAVVPLVLMASAPGLAAAGLTGAAACWWPRCSSIAGCSRTRRRRRARLSAFLGSSAVNQPGSTSFSQPQRVWQVSPV
jgi:hypothetical protein